MPGTSFSTANWGAYDEHSADISPGGTLTDFSLLIDIAELSSTFGSTVQSDGGDIRCTDESDNELPFDLIDWNYGGGSPTGFIRVKRSLATATSTQKVRVWYDYTPGTAVAYDANETYGQWNAYDSDWYAYYPLRGSNLAQAGADRVNGPAGNLDTETGTPVYGSNGVTLDGVDEGLYTANAVDNADRLTTLSTAFIKASRSAGVPSEVRVSLTYGRQTRLQLDTGNNFEPQYRGQSVADDIAISATTEYTFAVTSDTGIPSQRGYVDGVDQGGSTSAAEATETWDPNSKRLFIGSENDDRFYCAGTLSDASVHRAARSADWVALESDQLLDNAAFWGTWTSNSSGGGGGPTATFTPKIMIWT